MSFDIVIPLAPKDSHKFGEQIKFTKNNVIGYRNIYIVTLDDRLNIEGCKTISEKIFPFSINDVANYHEKLSRNGWYLQQLIKFYAGSVIPGILDRYLVLDSDTFFLKPTSFIEGDKCLYNTGTEYHIPYFKHIEKLCPFVKRISPSVSGICHHMMFERRFLDEFFVLVENIHNMPFWKAFLSCVEKDQYKVSGASEYEMYFNFIMLYHSDKVKIRNLKWDNISIYSPRIKDFDYISDHVWIN